MTPLWHAAAGSHPCLTNGNSLGGIAYNPTSGNLLLVSRACSNAIYVLDGNTGAFIRSLVTSPISGGTLALNMIAVAEDGAIYAGNLTTNGSTQNFKLYGWIDDSGLDAPYLAWEGDPAPGTADRWGDTFAARGFGDFVEVLVGSHSNAVVSFISTQFGSLAA